MSYGMGLGVVIVVALLTHLPMPFNNLSTDDYLIRANVMGNAELLEKGLVLADPEKSVAAGLSDAFHFYSTDAETLAAYSRYGNLPWWSVQDATMSPWRPVSALTHWLDFQVAPASFRFQVLHSLIYLMLFGYASYRLFWRLSSQGSIALLAAIFVVVDYSHFINFSWVAARNVYIAGAFGCLALDRFILWRQQRTVLQLISALVLFGALLLSAEAGIALLGYLLAYLWLIEKARVRGMVTALWPFLAVVVVWRLLYSYCGFGASGISLYVNPMQSPLEFVGALLQTAPVLFSSVITSIDGYLPSLAPGLRLGAISFAALIAMVGIWMIVPLLRRSERVRFMFVGSVLSAIPASALISGSSRSTVFIAIGFFWILSCWLHELLQVNQKRLRRYFAHGVVGVHLILPVVISFLVSSMLLPVTYSSDMQYESVEKPLQQSAGDRSLVVVNSRAPNREFYLPFTWLYEYGVAPKSINSIAPGMTSFYLTRNSVRDFELSAPRGLALTDSASIRGLDGEQPPLSEVYYLQMLQGLFTGSGTRYRVGDVRRAGDMILTVMSVLDGQPSRVNIRFDAAVNPDAMLWQWYDWESRQYRLMEHLAVGESRFYPGPLDANKRDLVNLCWNCQDEDSPLTAP